jgi:sigma-B regulation protein RsbU (phosphoserine phosphatase)
MIQRRVLTGLVGPSLVAAASRWCQALGSDFELSDEDRHRIELCGEELATNLVKYGSASEEGQSVEWSADVSERRVLMSFVDECPPFDPLAYEVTEIPATLGELQLGGLGLQLLREFTDDQAYEYRDGRNRLTLTFALTEPAHAPARLEGLDKVTIFGLVPQVTVDDALGVLTVQDVVDDVTLMERGDSNNWVLLVLEGELRVYLDRPEGDEFIGVAAGECVGEMSVIDEQPVSAFVRALAGTRLIVIDADTFLNRVIAIPRVARNLMSAQAERMRRSDKLTIKRMRELMAAEQARREMDFARGIQASLLPAEPLFADDARLDCVGRMRPARDVGGDFYDLFFLDDRHLLFVVADVCGKGLPAALFMVRAIAALRAQPRGTSPSGSHLEELMAKLNDELCDRNAARQFLTAFCGLLDLDTYLLRYVNAGHNPPVLAIGDAPFDYLREPVNPPVGMVPGLGYRTGQVQLEPGSRLVVYTDGVTEAEDATTAMLGEESLLARVRGLPGAASTNLVDAVFTEVDDFAAGAQQSDDITVLAIGLLGTDAG